MVAPRHYAEKDYLIFDHITHTERARARSPNRFCSRTDLLARTEVTCARTFYPQTIPRSAQPCRTRRGDGSNNRNVQRARRQTSIRFHRSIPADGEARRVDAEHFSWTGNTSIPRVAARWTCYDWGMKSYYTQTDTSFFSGTGFVPGAQPTRA